MIVLFYASRVGWSFPESVEQHDCKELSLTVQHQIGAID